MRITMMTFLLLATNNNIVYLHLFYIVCFVSVARFAFVVPDSCTDNKRQIYAKQRIFN